MTIQEINHEIEQLEPAEVNFRNVQVLSSLYVIRDKLGIGYAPETYRFPILEGSDLNVALSEKRIKDALSVLNELMDAIKILSPKLYNATIDKLSDL